MTFKISEDLELYSKKYPNLNPSLVLQYGTSGFRNKAESLFHITFRIGILATLRSRVIKSIVGVMITASHNPEADNGLKLIETDGSMLDQSWESIATKLANLRDADLRSYIDELIKEFNINLEDNAKVYVARDTRKSSLPLSEALLAGIRVSGGEAVNFNLLTTPQLHYIVCCANGNGQYGEPNEEGYYKKLSGAFLKLTEHSKEKLFLVVDCANGVGASKMQSMAPYISEKITFNLVNTGNGILNFRCGADFVKVNQTQPESVDLKVGQRYASFDGDADRVVYFYKNSKDNKFHLMDGDKISVLAAKFLTHHLKKAELDIKITVVQTAYANGASTKHMKSILKLTTDCVPTGVKHLHHRAKQAEIGIYFEANGHGTILFSEETQKRIANCKNESAQVLLHFVDLVNQTVGDAISDMLIVEAILSNLEMTIEKWDSFYTDLPNRLLKVSVKDRNVIQTTNAERVCLKPEGLQAAIDNTVAEFGPLARSFIRPSGTEDVVRIYAEAISQELADGLAEKVSQLVKEMAGGV